MDDLKNLMPVGKSGVKPAARVLSRAFQDSPIFTHMLPDPVERKNKLHYLFEIVVRDSIRYGEVYATSQNLEGVAVWIPSERGENMSQWRMIRAGALSLPFRYSRDFLSRQSPVTGFIDAAHKRHAPFLHWFLQAIGVDPAYQGKGYASRLLKPMLARIDRENLPCYLDTEEEKNVSIYQHYNFKVLEEGEIPSTDIVLRAMLREKSRQQ